MSKRFTNGETRDPRHPVELTPAEEVERERSETAQATPATTENAQLAAELEAKGRELAELNDKYLRALAEAENTRKRTRQQSEETVRLQRENLLREILPIVDNLERAVHAAKSGADNRALVDGVELVLRSLLDLLKTHGVTPLSVVGEPFDPNRHEAVEQVASAEHPPNTVVSEYHRGYLIGDRMLRPARVAVTKGNAGNARAHDHDEEKASES
jgi:molecular chaperone GrpE